jgi:hypothetical protein
VRLTYGGTPAQLVVVAQLGVVCDIGMLAWVLLLAGGAAVAHAEGEALGPAVAAERISMCKGCGDG